MKAICQLRREPWPFYTRGTQGRCDGVVILKSLLNLLGNEPPFFTLVDLQLDVQNYYLFTYNTFIKILYMFRALPCSSAGGLRRNCIYAASGIVTVCR